MKQQWIAMEHYRMHNIEEWPDGPVKAGALAAVQSALAGLSRGGGNAQGLECQICLNRKRAGTLVEMPLERAA